MFIKFSAVVIAALALSSCGGGTEKNTTADSASSAAMPMHQHSEADSKKDAFANVKFDLAKDPACNMPISAGVEDTAHYKDKVYGFCSKECKEEFLKDPESYLAKK